jgi:Protein of unknown function (DUF3108)
MSTVDSRLSALGRLLFVASVLCSLQLHASGPKRPHEVFPEGETLTYEVRWNPPAWMFFLPTISAGEMTLRFENHGSYEGKPAYRISARAISSGVLPKLTGMTIDDSFESVVDASEFCSYQMTKRLREGKRHRDIFLNFDGERGKGQIRVYDTSKAPPAELRNEQVNGFPKCVQDILSAIYFTRLKDLRLGDTYRIAVSDDGMVKQVEVNVRKKESVAAVAGQFTALRLEAISAFGGLFKGGGTFVVWMSDDDRKLPVRFEARVRLGKVFGTIKQFKR